MNQQLLRLLLDAVDSKVLCQLFFFLYYIIHFYRNFIFVFLSGHGRMIPQVGRSEKLL